MTSPRGVTFLERKVTKRTFAFFSVPYSTASNNLSTASFIFSLSIPE